MYGTHYLRAVSTVFVRTATLILALNLVVKGVYLFGIERVVQNTLPAGDYGLYFQLLNLTMLLQIVADFGLQLYNSRNLAQSRHLLAKYFPYLLGLKLVLGMVFLVSVAAEPGCWNTKRKFISYWACWASISY